MSTRRLIAIVLIMVMLMGLIVLTGCSSEADDATFLGYKQRPTDAAPEGVAIVQLSNGTPAEAKCTYRSLENGDPIKVVKSGDSYEVVSSSPDWGQ